MSWRKFVSVLKSTKVHHNDRTWFPRWLDAYRKSCGVGPDDTVPVERTRLIAFLKDEKAKGRKAWQRLQIVQAVEFYRDPVLRARSPDLSDIRNVLAKVAEQERSAKRDSMQGKAIDVVGVIDLNEPEPIQRLRRELRLLHRSPSTEKANVLWNMQFLNRFGVESMDDLTGMGESEITQFLTELAVDRNVAASTQNQAFNALLCLSQRVLKRKMQFINAVRAKRPERLPVVLSREEIARLLAELGGQKLLIARILYGAGLRLKGCLRLRV